MKRLLIVSSHFPPDRGAGTHRVLRFTKHLSASGWDVAVLTMDPDYYPSGTQIDLRLLDEIPESVRVHRTRVLRGMAALIHARDRLWGPRAEPAASSTPGPVRAMRRPSIFRRVKDMATDLCSIPDRDIGWFWYAAGEGASIVRRRGVDVILSSGPPFTCHIIAGALRRLYGVKWVADFRDPWARSPWAQKADDRAWKRRVQRWLERRAIRAADAVILNTAPMHAEFAAYYGPAVARKFRTITNGYDMDVVAPFVNVSRPRSGALVVTHAGTLYRERDPRTLLTALAAVIEKGQVPAEGIRLHFVGGIAERFGVPRVLRELKLDSVVRVTPPVSHQESLRSLAGADVLLVVQPGTDLQVPAKLYEYMAFRKPILAIAEPGAVAEIMAAGRLGLVVAPDDGEGIERALCQLYRDRHRLADAFRIDEDYVGQYEGRILSRRLQNLLMEVSNGHPDGADS